MGFRKMAHGTWIEPKSHYQATGDVDGLGKMTNAEITDNNGITRDRDRTFESQAAFESWAKSDAGINW